MAGLRLVRSNQSRAGERFGVAPGSDDLGQLMAAAQGGDRAAYRALLTRIAVPLRSIAARQLRNPSDAEEVVQDILLTIHAVRHTYDPARPFLPWLVTIARRRVVDRLRSHARDVVAAMEVQLEAETFSTSPVNPVERDWSPSALQSAIDGLPDTQRQAVTMLKLQEMSLAEAAAASGLSIGTLKVATHRAIKRLRSVLLGDANESR